MKTVRVSTKSIDHSVYEAQVPDDATEAEVEALYWEDRRNWQGPETPMFEYVMGGSEDRMIEKVEFL